MIVHCDIFSCQGLDCQAWKAPDNSAVVSSLCHFQTQRLADGFAGCKNGPCFVDGEVRKHLKAVADAKNWPLNASSVKCTFCLSIKGFGSF